MRLFVPLVGLLIVLAAGTAIGWYVGYDRNAGHVIESRETRALDSVNEPSQEVPVNDVVESTQGGGPTVDELSLAAFANQEFAGSNFTVGRVLADNSSYTRHYITYESNGLTISGIMNLPKGEGPFPVLLLNHGFIDPAVYTNGRGLKREQDYLARQGYVVIHSDYRNHADSDVDPATDREFRFGYATDVINAIHALREVDLPTVDTGRVGMLGHSMGGGIAWKIAVTQPGLVDAYVQFAPTSADERDTFNKWIRPRTDVAESILAKHGEPDRNPAFWDGLSPLNYFTQIAAPIMIHHGTADADVPLVWSERAVDALEAAQKEVTFHVYSGEPHEFAAAWPEVMRRTTTFFDDRM